MSGAKITFTVPPPSNSPFIFRRAFLGAIRTAISQAHADGMIDVKTAVAALAALPIADPPK